ncbi:hypothetical protein [Deinococcus sonorensis]|uniref:Uncharacterized protein n=2 Tax=Deinococcus sonorensis TaxID=309891 RepID=A0AAU7U4X1_9DEIO
MITFQQHHDHAQATLRTLHQHAEQHRALPAAQPDARRAWAHSIVVWMRSLHRPFSSHA